MIRMCARCERTTDNPVVVHEVHAATGPGFHVYACPECAQHYAPQQDPLDLLDATLRPSRMTIRVYTVSPDGTTSRDGGVIRTCTGDRVAAPPPMTAYPPCACPRCRTVLQPR
ncbi:hypothetical protein [Streptomyces sp. NPDC046862]|uniref:hypothetical protein n=1 Tax=Streptomyces sp. NPDC046862 TaxID=3154603 RepID=UPI0034549A5D